MRKAVSLIFLIISLFLMAVSANAQTPDTIWYTTNPEAASFTISTADGLRGLSWLVNRGNNFSGKTITLANNIDLSDYMMSDGWIPIGTYNSENSFRAFSGTFDGGGFVISNLTINKPRFGSFQGLFGYIRNGRVENLGLDNINITGSYNVGGIAGHIYRSTITNSYSVGTIRATQIIAGGVVGHVDLSTVDNSYFSGEIIYIGDDHNDNGYSIGGIAGYIRNSTVSNSYSAANISGRINVGGIVGTVYDSRITNCYSTGTISGAIDVGGVAGIIQQGSADNNYSTGMVSGNLRIGGLVGNLMQSGWLVNGYSIGAVNGDSLVGGVVGYAGPEYRIRVTNCVALNPEVKGNSNLARVVGDTGDFDVILSNNAAYDGMTNNAGLTTWTNKGANNIDGADISLAQILADGTIGGRFTTEYGWTIANGSLPGLLGQTVPLPVHLGGTSINPQFRQRQSQNPSSFTMRISPAKSGVSNIIYTLNTESSLSISVYNLKGKKVAFQPKRLRTAGEHNFSFKAPKGFYIVEARVQDKSGVGMGERDAKHRVFTERVLVR